MTMSRCRFVVRSRVALRHVFAGAALVMLASVGLIGVGSPASAAPTAGAAQVGRAQSHTFVDHGPIQDGYWEVASDGGIFSYGGASFYGSTGSIHLNKPIVGMASTPDGGGYWLVASDGGIFNYGDAQFYGSTGGLVLNKPIVGMASTPDGGGYWLVASDGGIFSFGNAVFHGSTGGTALNKPIVGMASTPDGGGYWLVASDGGIFNYGDAQFYGSTGGLVLNKPIVGMASTPDGGGYWLVASDGGIFSFGNAVFHGSTGGIALNKPIVGMAASSDGGGYWLVASDGGIFSFGNAHFYGSTGSLTLNKPIVGMAAPVASGPAGAASSGRLIDPGNSITGVSCPTSTWCMAVDDSGNIMNYDNGTWSAPQLVDTGADVQLGQGEFDGVSCPTTAFCLAVSYDNGVSYYTNGSWSPTAFTSLGTTDFSGVSCQSTTFCLASSLHGDGMYEYLGGTSWRSLPEPVMPGTEQSTTPVSCPEAAPSAGPWCMVVDTDNNYSFSYYNMAGIDFTNPEPISAAVAAAGAQLTAVSCTSASFCVAADQTSGYAEEWNGSWTDDGLIDTPTGIPGIQAVSCSGTTCAAVDFDHNVLFTQDGVHWTAPEDFGFDLAADTPTAVSCASTSFCMAADSAGYAYTLNPSA